MNSSFVFEDQVYDWVGFKKLARTPVPKLPPSYPRGCGILLNCTRWIGVILNGNTDLKLSSVGWVGALCLFLAGLTMSQL